MFFLGRKLSHLTSVTNIRNSSARFLNLLHLLHFLCLFCHIKHKKLVYSFYVFFFSWILTHLYVIKTVVRLFVWMLVQSKVTESPHSLWSYPLSRVQILLFRRMFLNHPLQSHSFFFPFGGSYNKATLCVLNSIGYILKTVYLSSRGKRSHTRKESQCYPISKFWSS